MSKENVAVFGFLKKRRLPADRRPKLGPEERIVAWAGATGDNVVVVTNHGLWLPGADDRLGWHEIHKATWSGRQLALVAARELPVDGADYVVMEDLPPLIITLLDPDRVPEQVRVRVNRSIAHTSHHPLSGLLSGSSSESSSESSSGPLSERAGVRVVGRRVPGVNGLRWTVRYDGGVDPKSPAVAEQTAELVAWAKSGTGPTP